MASFGMGVDKEKIAIRAWVKILIYSTAAKRIRIYSQRYVGERSASAAVSECCVDRLDLASLQSMAKQDYMLPGEARGLGTVSSKVQAHGNPQVLFLRNSQAAGDLLLVGSVLHGSWTVDHSYSIFQSSIRRRKELP